VANVVSDDRRVVHTGRHVLSLELGGSGDTRTQNWSSQPHGHFEP
jgi:hypothetical protein